MGKGFICPKCKVHFVMAGEKDFRCTGRRTGTCDWSLPRTIKGVTLTDDDMRKMLETGYSDPLNFQWKNGKTSTARLGVKDGKLHFAFPIVICDAEME